MAKKPQSSGVSFKWEFGPASIITFAGIIIQAAVFIWGASALYSGLTNKIEMQGNKIETVEKGSAERFNAVRDAIKETHTVQTAQADRVTKIEASVGFISSVVQRLETRLDGK
jgi:aerobic-type carbon monoxide dehydrogenase small subunit (CoxS/CutS family)